VDGSEFNTISLNREDFLRKTLAYGHLDLLNGSDMQIISRTDFLGLLGNGKQAEQWLADLLAECDEDEVKYAILNPCAGQNNFQRLFFSEAVVFQRYLNNEALPLLTLEDQVKTVLITELPQNLLELKPTRFWEYWVRILFFSLII